MSASDSSWTRRSFLSAGASGAAGLWLGLFGSRRVVASGHATTGLSTSAFLHIALNGTVEIFCARSEMGQGVRSALPLLIADELGADPLQVKILQADGNTRYGNQNTDGSSSVRGVFEELRRIGAVARTLLTTVAATQWQVPFEQCTSSGHAIVHATSGRTLPFSALVERAAQLPVPKSRDVRLRPRSELPHLGKSAPLIDAKAFVTGTAHYGADIRLPAMLIAVIERPPALFDEVESFDAQPALSVPGVKQLITLKGPKGAAGFQPLGGVAVVADNTWAAMRGRAALSVKWKGGPNRDYNSARYRESLLATVRSPCKVVRSSGDVDSAMKSAARILTAEYTMPHLAQAPMEPPAALVHIHDGKCEIWAPTQSPQTAQSEVAQALGIAVQDVLVHVTFLGGGFGRKSKPDFIVEAALIAQQLGAPVRVQWTRKDDLTSGYVHTASAQRLEAGLSLDGKVVAWRHRTVFPTISSTFSKGANRPSNGELAQGATDLPLFIPNFCVEAGQAQGHTRIGWMRSVCNLFHAYAAGSFVDEIAAARATDPRDTWLELLGPPRLFTAKEAGTKLDNYGASLDEHPIDVGRLRRVIERVTEHSGFVGRKIKDGAAFGLAAHRSFLSYVAVVAKVKAKSDGGFRTEEVWISIDAGTVLNLDRVRAQMEGAVIFGLSLFLHGAITMKGGVVEQHNFRDYRLARIGEAPRQIHVDVVPSDAPPGGVGEPGVPPVAPAIGNALFALTGLRLRDLPYSGYPT